MLGLRMKARPQPCKRRPCERSLHVGRRRRQRRPQEGAGGLAVSEAAAAHGSSGAEQRRRRARRQFIRLPTWGVALAILTVRRLLAAAQYLTCEELHELLVHWPTRTPDGTASWTVHKRLPILLRHNTWVHFHLQMQPAYCWARLRRKLWKPSAAGLHGSNVRAPPCLLECVMPVMMMHVHKQTNNARVATAIMMISGTAQHWHAHPPLACKPLSTDWRFGPPGMSCYRPLIRP
ncbi:unnamed protein product [Prorocentrum cordatum]|uniref:Uncharacterized protein n=1 Tax=Prorocentrum cordatum TaxID=2364126 RepID=A0ABN9RJ07_9DINO|nr:unnamed protein product [Polarella glacialis]